MLNLPPADNRAAFLTAWRDLTRQRGPGRAHLLGPLLANAADDELAVRLDPATIRRLAIRAHMVPIGMFNLINKMARAGLLLPPDPAVLRWAGHAQLDWGTVALCLPTQVALEPAGEA